MILESDKVQVKANIQTVFDFLKDAHNINFLLPQNNVSDFTADDTSCSFKAQGGFVISLIQEKLEEPTKIHMKSGEKAPFPFKLVIHLEEKGDETEGQIVFDGEVNMFMKMLVEKPLGNLFNYMSKKLHDYYAQ